MRVLRLVNGNPHGSVEATDRGLAYGDGIFRTLLVRGGRPLNWKHHLARLVADGGTLGLPVPEPELLRREIATVAPGDALVKIVLTRGASGRGYAFAADASPTRLVMAFPVPASSATYAAEGVAVRRCALVLSEQPRLAGAKHLNRLESVLARSEWTDPAIREGLLGDARGHVIEATAANVFIARDGALATPDLSRSGVAGAQRARVLALARDAGIGCALRDIGWDEFLAADEVFLTNSVIGLWPVARLGERRWSPGPLARRFQAGIEEDDARAP
jgi:4-amino-4-deoxychorismate lyase